ncbi:tripartite motif-containing protein 3-like [Haliotis cracherodii]|uniref:tripartite motif-containing protein 3-like n=1 Tax=Haliotis cracherodii TaxID=6455 RepID=UPI0039ED4E58
MASLKSGEQFLTCNLCLQVFQSPCKLACFHNVCRKCVVDYTETRPEAISAKSLLCPFCNKMTTVSAVERSVEGSADDAKPRFVSQSLLNTCSKETSNIETPKETREPVATKGRGKIICEEYKEKTARFTCKTCNKAVCETCCTAYHSKCASVVTIESEMLTVKSQLTKFKNRLSRREDEIKTELRRKKFIANGETVRYLQLESDIRSLSNKVIEMIKRKERLLIEELKSISDKHVRQFQEDITSYEMSLEKCQQQAELIDQVLQSESDMDVYEMYQACEAGDVEAVGFTELKEKGRIARIMFRQDTDKLSRELDDLQLGEIDVLYEGVLDLMASHEILDTSKVLDLKISPETQDTSKVLDLKASPEILDTSKVLDLTATPETQDTTSMLDLKASPEILDISTVLDQKASPEIADISTVLDLKASPEIEDISTLVDLKATPELQDTSTLVDLKAVSEIQDASNVMDLAAAPMLLETLNVGVEEDANKALPIDVIMMVVNGTDTVITTDYSNKSVKSFYISNNKPSYSKLTLDSDPWSLTKLKYNHIAVTVPKIKQIVIVEASPDLVLLSTIPTSKEYRGITALAPSTLAVCTKSPPCVEILDVTGNVLRSISPSHHGKNILKYPYFLSATNTGNILVSDSGSMSVLCLKPDGDVVFTYTPTGISSRHGPQGVICTATGDILVTEFDLHNVVHLTEAGQFVEKILTAQDGVDKPRGLCVAGRGSVYVCNSFKGQIKVFKC